MFKKIIATFIVLILTTAISASAEVISKVAAVVNDAVITTRQLDRAFEESLKLNPGSATLSNAEKEKLRLKLLDKLIEEELFKDRVQQLRLKVSDEDVDAAVTDVQAQNNLTREQLKMALEQQGMAFETYRENLRKQILRFKLIGIEVQSKAEVTSAEVREYYRDHLDEYREAPFMRLSRLTFPIPRDADEAAIDELRDLAVEARGKMKKGEEISSLLVAYALSGVEGGDMGKFRVGELSETFDRAVRKLETGDLSDIVEVPNGFFIFRMDERSNGEEKPFDEVRAGIERILLEKKREQAFEDWNRELRKEAYIDIRI